ncbi:MAG TPA: hypothetical protein VIY72_15815, partial [Acidimicrobiales bacterium]
MANRSWRGISGASTREGTRAGTRVLVAATLVVVMSVGAMAWVGSLGDQPGDEVTTAEVEVQTT